MDSMTPELLSEVLGERIRKHDSAFDRVTESVVEGNLTHVKYMNVHGVTHTYHINVHELSHECKKWAYTRGYSFTTYLIDDKWYVATEDSLFPDITRLVSDFTKIKLKLIDDFTSETEPEASFKACEWVKEHTS